MLERRRFVKAAQAKTMSFAELCRLFDISRKTGYKWLGRGDEGEVAFEDRPRRPHSNSRAVDAKLEARLVRLRQKYPTWGARKLLAWLEDREPSRWDLPAASTVTELLKRRGLVPTRTMRRRLPPRTTPFAVAQQPNDLWCMDFKGDFRVGDGRRIYPFTLTDAYSRMLLCVHGLPGTTELGVRAALERAFRTWGLPTFLRSDNGTPFATMRTGPLSRLSAWLVKVGVMPEYTDVASPHQNGRHERMHLTLKLETAMPPADSFEQQQRRFDRFRRIFNRERPHEALGQKPPASVHRRSARPFPSRIKDPEYPGSYEPRRLSKNGDLVWRSHRLFFSEALRGELVGLTQVSDGGWEIYFGPLLIARLHESMPNQWCRPQRIKVSPMSPV